VIARAALLALAGVLGCGPQAIAQDAVPRPQVDAHQHLFNETIARRSKIEPVDAGRLIQFLDAAGIRQAVVLSLAYSYANPNRPPVEDESARVKAENDWTSTQVARFPGRLFAFCSVNPLKPYALGEIARCAADPRLKLGLKLHFGNSDVNLADAVHVARLREVFAAANRAGMAIVLHMRSTVSRDRPYGAFAARALLDQVLPSAPDVPVQIAHLAGAGGYDDPLADEALGVFVEAIAKKDPRMARVWFDVSGVAGLGDWKAKADTIVARIRALGVERILYGSDGTAEKLAPREAWETFATLPLTPAELRTIAGNVPPYLR
jgi:predicted TIM-barrel fold metal-dependent hydrolase